MIVLGVDPGFSGALAVLNSERHCETIDMPTMGEKTKKLVDGQAIKRFIEARDVDYAVIEQSSAMPKQGVSSMFRLGTSYGLVLGVIQGMAIPYETVSPRKWKGAMNLSSDKELSRRTAIEQLPLASKQFERKKDHGRAEAALIALWKLTSYPPVPLSIVEEKGAA